MTTPSLRHALQHAVPVSAALAVAASSLLMRDELGSAIVTSWPVRPDAGRMAPGDFSAVLMLLTLTIGLFLLMIARGTPRRELARGAAAAAHGIPVFLATLHLGVLRLNALAVGDEIGSPGGWLLAALGAGALAAVVGWLVGPDGTDRPPTRLDAVPVTVEAGEAVVWTGQARAEGWLLAIPAMLLLIGGGVLVQGEALAAGILTGAAAIVVTMLRVTVTIGPNGLQVRGGPFGVARTTVPLDQITEVFAEHVDPLAYGGWGYRMLPGVRAITVRCGEGLHLRRGDGPDLVITVDDAPRGAGVLLAHLAAQHA